VLDFLALGRAETDCLRKNPRMHAQVASSHDVVEHVHALEEGDVLKGARNSHYCGAVRLHVRELFSLEADLALLRVVDAVQYVEHRRLTGAVRPDDGAHLMRAHVERHVLQRLDAAEGERHAFDGEDDLADLSGRRMQVCLRRRHSAYAAFVAAAGAKVLASRILRSAA
jgi:hypothetical protein